MGYLRHLVMIAGLFSCSHQQFLYRTVPLAPGEKFEEHYASSKEYMIASQGRFSTEAGKKMFALGGNAADAAAAVSFVISVERPQSTGIGGGGFLLYKSKDGKSPKAYDFREKAPLKAHEKMYLNSNGEEIKGKSLTGIHAGGVPGLVAGIFEFHKTYGKLKWETVLGPAIELAEKGFDIYPELDKALKYKAKTLAKFPSTKKIFFKNGRVLRLGERLVQKDLAKTLKTIANKGRRGFYKGWVSRAFVKEAKKRGGYLSQKDMDSYNVKVRKPVSGTFKDYQVFSMSPPSSGGIHVIQILNMLENLPLKSWGVQDARTIHYTASAMQQAFADRARYLGDADFVKVPQKELTSKEYAKKKLSGIPAKKALRKEEVYPGKFEGYESDETTHFTIMDKEGNIVSSTQTINGYFGASLVISGTGVILNNEMDDFATKVGASNLFGAVGGRNNLVAPEKRPLSSMSPTIVLKDEKPVLALGTPSGTRILTCVAQTILNYLEHDMSLLHAVAAVRYHQQWSPDSIRIGEMSLPYETENELRKMGHELVHKNLGCRIQAIAKKGERLIGVSDPRGQGMAAGK